MKKLSSNAFLGLLDDTSVDESSLQFLFNFLLEKYSCMHRKDIA